jgi:hypothetical protein
MSNDATGALRREECVGRFLIRLYFRRADICARIKGGDAILSAILTIRGQQVIVDIERELREFTWNRPQWLADKLLAASPFRYDRAPSFYVYLEDTTTARAGDWGDSGASEAEYARGGFVKLLAFLRNETEEDTRTYLYDTYDASASFAQPDYDNYSLHIPELHIEERRKPLDLRILDDYHYRHGYLESRGISEAVQRLMSVGYDRKRSAVTFPWFNTDGSLANVKWRRTDAKTFWYAKGGRPIRELIYGIDVIYMKRIRRAAIVEAEVDAMTLMAAGFPAVATGGSMFSVIKRDIIVKSPLEEIVVVRDNDAAGRKWQRKVIAELAPYMSVKVAVVGSAYKDVNEAWCAVDAVKVERARTVGVVKVTLM